MPHSDMSRITDTSHTLWSLRTAASALRRYSMSQGRWHYKDGLLFAGIHQLAQHTADSLYWDSVQAYIDCTVDASGAIKAYRLGEYNIDDISPGRLLFPLYERTGDERYKKAILLLREQLRGQPRTREGGFWHKQIYPFQMWLDGIYMGTPFYAQFGVTFEEPAALDDVAFQIFAVEKHNRDAATGLLYHGWDESRRQPWADPETGCSSHFWSRAIGWYVMALVDVLDIFPPDHMAYTTFIDILERTIAAVAHVQDQATGLWWQILDQGDRPGNYLEASGTSMYVYAISRGIRKGYLDAKWQTVANRAFEGLLEHMITIDDEGQVDLHGICSTAGLGGTPYRDGSFEYYISEPILTNDLHGVGAFLLAAVEVEFGAQSDSRE